MIFEKYAELHNFDPLSPENWYNVSGLDVSNFEVNSCSNNLGV